MIRQEYNRCPIKDIDILWLLQTMLHDSRGSVCLKSKSASKAYPALMEVIKIIERDIRDKVVMVRANNAKGEFGPKFQNKCKEDGMQFEPCFAYKHSLNGISEQAVYTTDCKI
jgi:hypothetical protein